LEKESLGTKRWVKIACCLLAAVIAQTTLSQQLKPWLAWIDWLLLVTVYVSLMRDPTLALITATAAGLLYDASSGGLALGVNGLAGTRLEFEVPLPTGLPGDPPTVDVALHRPDGRRVAIESKFAEWLTPRPRGKRVFKDKYFAQGQRVWEAAGLPRCQALADELQGWHERPRYLNAAQLLKHALGLAVNGLRTSTLVYLYYDRPGREAATHRAELNLVAARLGGEVDLRVATYQSLFDALRTFPELDRDYLDYLAGRYFA